MSDLSVFHSDLLATPRLQRLDLQVESDGIEAIKQYENYLSRNTLIQREINLRFIRGKFALGEAVVWLSENKDMSMDDISNATLVSKRTLYDARRFYLHDEFDRRPAKMEEWMEAMIGPLGVKFNWRWCLDWMKKGRRDGRSEIEKKLDNARRYVQGAEAIAEDLTELINRRNGSLDREMAEEARILGDSLLSTYSENTQSIDRMEEVISQRPESEAFLRFTRETERCCVSGLVGPVDPHHIEQGGMGMKGSDFTCIPVNRNIHNQIEDKGHKWVEEKYGVDFTKLLLEHVLDYLHAIHGYPHYETRLTYA